MDKRKSRIDLHKAVFEANTFCHTLELPEKGMILYPWLPEQSISLIYGWRGIGKSWFALGLADAVTRGEPFGPWEVRRPVPVLYLDAEMAAADIKERLQHLNPSFERRQPLYVYCDSYANHLGFPRAHLLNREWRQAIQAYLTENEVKLWIADNLSSLAAGIDENSAQAWAPINQFLLQLRFCGISTVLLHHTSKAGEQRGTSAREDNLDCSVQLRQPSDYVPEQGAKFVASFRKARVRNSELQLVADALFHLSENGEGELCWTWGNVKREVRADVLRMLDEGASGKDIADCLGITKGRVSQIKKQALDDGYLNGKGKLTQGGLVSLKD